MPISLVMDDTGRLTVLAAVCIVGGYLDLRTRRVPNHVTVPAMVAGLLAMAIHHGYAGLLNGVTTGACCFLFMVLARAMGGVGGGDVKMATAIACTAGWPLTARAALYGFIVGGILAILVLLWQRDVLSALCREISAPFDRRNPTKNVRPGVPMAFALALGTLLAVVSEGGNIAQLTPGGG